MECTPTVPSVPVRGWKRQNGLQPSSQLIHGRRADIGRISTPHESILDDIALLLSLCIMYLLFIVE